MQKVRQDLSASEADALIDGLTRRLERVGVPTLPEVAVKVLDLTEKPGSSFKDFAEVVGSDQALTGKLLRMANSAYFAQSREVTSIERAMMLIGLQRLKALVLGFHLAETAGKSQGVNLREIWTQSIFRGWLAHGLAEQVCPDVRGESFIVGLISDAGLPLMPLLLNEYDEVIGDETMPSKRYLAERRGLAFTHVDVATALCRMWNFPERLAKPIRLHHDPIRTPDLRDSAHALHAIAYLSGSIDLGVQPDPCACQRMPEAFERLLNLTASDATVVMRDAGAAFKASKDLFSSIMDPDTNPEKLLRRANAQLVKQIEELLDDAASAPSPSEVVEVGEMAYELRMEGPGRLLVVIVDSSGVPIFEERLEVGGLDDKGLRVGLLLDAAGDDDANRVIECVRRLAA